MRLGVEAGGSWGTMGSPTQGCRRRSGPSRAASLDCHGGAPRPRGRAGIRRPRLRVPRAPARPRRARGRRDGHRGRRAGARGVGGTAPADVRGRRAGALLRAARPRVRRRGRSTSGAAGCTTRSSEPLVVNWQAPAARPFYTATPGDPHGVTLRRRFRTEGRRVLDISDERSTARRSVAGVRLPARGARAQPRRAHARHRRDDPVGPVPADHARARAAARRPGRAGHRQDRGRAPPCVLAALRATRSRCDGCSSSGRTRRSWSTSRTCSRRSARRRSSSAPSTELVDGIEAGREDEPDVARLKGDPRLAELSRAAAARSLPAAGGARRSVDGVYVRVREREVAELRRGGRWSRRGRSAQARERFRMDVLRRFYEDYGDAARRARLPRLRRDRERCRARGLPDALARPRLADGRGRRRSCARSSPSARARGGGGRHSRRLGAGAAPAAARAVRLERGRRGARRRGARPARRRRRARSGT